MRSVDFSSDGQSLVTASDDKTVKVRLLSYARQNFTRLKSTRSKFSLQIPIKVFYSYCMGAGLDSKVLNSFLL